MYPRVLVVDVRLIDDLKEGTNAKPNKALHDNEKNVQVR